jgi:hypothetical protein
MKHRDEMIAEARARSRETLAQSDRENYGSLNDGPPIEDAGLAWRRSMDASEREQAAALEDLRRASRQGDLDFRLCRIEQRLEAKLVELLDERIAQERERDLTELNDLTREVLTQAIVQVRDEARAEITAAIDRAYTEAFAEVRADVNALRKAIEKLGGVSAAVIDLPTRRVN